MRVALQLLVSGLAAAGLAACALIGGIDQFGSSASATSDASGDVSIGTDAGITNDGSASDGNVASDVEVDAGPCTCDGGAVCYKGGCYPQTLQTGLSDPRTIVVAGEWVVWTEYGGGAGLGKAKACATASCTSVSDLATGATRPRITQAGSGVDSLATYYEENGGAQVREVVAGAPPTLNVLATVTNSPSQAAASSTWILYGVNMQTLVARSRLGFGEQSVPPGINGEPEQIAIAGDRAYWSSRKSEAATCTLPSCGDLVNVVFGGPNVDDMVIDTDQVHAVGRTSLGEGVLSTRALNPGPSKINPPDVKLPKPASAIAVDATDMYLSMNDRIVRVDKQTRTPTQRYPSSTGVRDLALDKEFIYWIDGQGRLVKAPK